MIDLTSPEHAHVAERLRENVILWLSSVRPDGRPHLVPVWYLWTGGQELLIFSKPRNQKVRDLEHNPAVMLSLDDTHDGDDVIMLEGTAELLPADALSASYPAYDAKYGERIRQLAMSDAATMMRIYSQGIRITLTRSL